MTTFNLSPFVPAWTDRFLLIALSTITALKLLFLLLSDPKSRTGWRSLLFCAIPVSLVWFLVYLNDRFLSIAYLSVLVLGCIGTDYRTLLKVQVCVVGAVVLSAALCCMGGAIENRVYWGHGKIRSSFGYTYPTNMAAYYVYLSAAAWIAWDEIWDPVFLLPGLLSLFISGVVADSRTCFLCSGLFVLLVLWCWLIRCKGKNSVIQHIQKGIGILCRFAFPLLAVAAVVLTVAYYKAFPFTEKLNAWMSGRLILQSNALYEHGISVFGNPFQMRGMASGFPVLDLNYVDCSYMQMLLQYGVLIFLIYLFLWPLMTDTAIRAGRIRLSMGLALTALHALAEQHFLMLDYNLLFIAPFSVFSLRAFPEPAQAFGSVEIQETWRKRYAAIVTAALTAIPLLLFWKPLLSGFRTIWTVLLSPDLTLQLYQRRSVFTVSICFLAGCVLLFFLIYKTALPFFLGKKPKLRYFAILLCGLFAGSLVLIKADRRIDRALEEYDPYLQEDASVISLMKSIDDLRMYETELPMLYDRRFGGVCTSFFNGEELARLHDVAVITDSGHHWPSMFHSGFSYAEINGQHAVYTDSPDLIEAMNDAGYNPVPYYSKELSVNMENLAEWNQLTLNQEGSLILSSDAPIMNVPDLDLKAGKYTFCFDLSMLPSSALKEPEAEDIVFTIGFSDNSGARKLSEQTVAFSQFDENGDLYLPITSFFNAAGVEFTLIPEPGILLALRGVSYSITP